MKKILIPAVILALSGFLFLPLITFGAVSYQRTPAGININSHVSFNVSLDSFEEIGCAETSDNWEILIYFYPYTSDYIPHLEISSTTLSYNLILDIPIGSQFSMVDLECDGAQIILEGSTEYDLIFQILPKNFIGLPTSLNSGILANISNQIADNGTLLIIALAGGIPLFFLIATFLISLFNEKRKDKAAKEFREKRAAQRK